MMKLRERNISKPSAPNSTPLLHSNSKRNIRTTLSRSNLRSAIITFFFVIGLIAIVAFASTLRVIDPEIYSKATSIDLIQNSEVSNETQNAVSTSNGLEQTFAGKISDIISMSTESVDNSRKSRYEMSSTISERKHISDVVNEQIYPHSIVAYSFSVISCNYGLASLRDAALILQHSIHKVSVRNAESGSKYDYRLYALLHPQALKCSDFLTDMGVNVVLVDPPVQTSEITNSFLRDHIKREKCCGADEFIKLHAYTLPHEIIVHVDIDFAFYKPMDHLFDSIWYSWNSTEGENSRRMLQLERPEEYGNLPDQIGAFMTKTWVQVAPGKMPAGFQAGFLVTRRDPQSLEDMTKIIKNDTFVNGFGWNAGWGGKGYAGFKGAMAMQGLVSYYYDHHRTNWAVELNQCRFNHQGMDIMFRAGPNFFRSHTGRGGCRNGQASCEDCMITDFDKIYSAHYTTCGKPWECRTLPNTMLYTNTEHCFLLQSHWHKLRKNFEEQLFNITGDNLLLQNRHGEVKTDIFFGHCDVQDGYLPILANKETLQKLKTLYSENEMK